MDLAEIRNQLGKCWKSSKWVQKFIMLFILLCVCWKSRTTATAAKKKKSLRWLPHFWPERSEDEIAIDLSGGEEVQACEEEEFTSPHAKFEM